MAGQDLIYRTSRKSGGKSCGDWWTCRPDALVFTAFTSAFHHSAL